MRREFRLRKNADFQRVRANRQSWAHPLLMLYRAPNALDLTRVGISVSRRVGKAVARNRVRRRIREAVRLRYSVLAGGFDLVFIAREPSVGASWVELRQAIDQLLRRAKLLE